MLYKKIIKNFSSLAIVLIASLSMAGCGGNNTDSVSNGNANRATTANANTSPEPSRTAELEAREPDRYSVETTVTVQPAGETPQANIPPLRFSFAKMGADNRRLEFNFPNPIGEVTYIEKGNFRYLIYPARNQYVELDPNELGFQLGKVMSPASMIERLKERTQYESLGTETINGRTAIKYRFKGAADTRTQAGTVQADSIIYVDQQTGLPLRSEVDAMLSSGKGARVVTETSSIELQPDATLFEVPTDMKKVTTAELKQQVQGFVSALRVFAGYMRQQAEVSPAPAN